MDKQMMLQMFEQFLNNPEIGMGFDSPELYNEPTQVIRTRDIQFNIPEKERRPLFDRSKFFKQQEAMLAPETDYYGLPVEQDDVGNQEAMAMYSGVM